MGRLVWSVAWSAERRHTRAAIDRAPSAQAGQRYARAEQPHRPSHAARRRGSGRHYRQPRNRAADAFDVTDILHAEPLYRLILREHLHFDDGAGQRVVIGLDERTGAEAEVNRRRPANAAVQRDRAMQRVEILVDVLVAMRHAQTPEVAERTTRVFAPVGAVHGDHHGDCIVIFNGGLRPPDPHRRRSRGAFRPAPLRRARCARLPPSRR
jgi:hypothetical protein